MNTLEAASWITLGFSLGFGVGSVLVVASSNHVEDWVGTDKQFCIEFEPLEKKCWLPVEVESM